MSKWTCTMPKRESPKRRLMWRNAPPMQCSMNCLSLIFPVRVLKRSVSNFWFWIPKGDPAMRWLGGWSWEQRPKEPEASTGRRSVTIPGDKSPSGICSVMVSILVMSWNLMILRGEEQFSFFLSDMWLLACNSKLPFLLLLLEMDWISWPESNCKCVSW